MDRFWITVAIIVFAALVLFLMYVGWRRRSKRDADLGAGYVPPVSAAPVTFETDTLYVATTAHDQPLERLSLPGLRFRARATVTVTSDGVTLSIAGEQPTFITASALLGVDSTNVAIDRVVERDGLVRIAWTTTGGGEADSFVRVVDPQERADLIRAVAALTATPDLPADPANDAGGPSREQTNEREV